MWSFVIQANIFNCYGAVQTPVFMVDDFANDKAFIEKGLYSYHNT